ncbi:MAG: hypothetical protein ACR65O_05320 [Methylomicrobium sp.]
MKFLSILKLVVSILPLLIDAIKSVEDAIPGVGKGEAKLAAVRSAMESSYKVSTDVQASFEEVWPVMENTVGGIVKGFNAAGVFKK